MAPEVRNFRGTGAMQCATEKREEKAREKSNVFSPDLNAVTDSLLTTVFGSEFQKSEYSIGKCALQGHHQER